MPEPPLTAFDRDLATVAAQSSQDQILVDLVQLAETGLGLAVGLFMNGMVVVGALASAHGTAERIDAESAKAMAHISPPEGVSRGEWEERQQALGHRYVRAVERYHERRQQLLDDADEQAGEEGLDRDTAPAELVRRLIEDEARQTLNLVQVLVKAPGEPRVMRLDSLRVNLRQIAGWWVIRTDEEGAATFSLFADE